MPRPLVLILRRFLDVPLLVGLALAAPIVEWRSRRRGRPRRDPTGRLGGGDRLPDPAGGRPRVLLHAVSVGEVNAIRGLVRELAGRADVVVSATTDTGLARARSLFEPAEDEAGAGRLTTVVRWPLDLSFAVDRFLDRVRPDAVGLVELEVWPGFTASAQARGIPIAVVNGRLSARSFERYRRIVMLVRPAFRRLARALVQDEAYAARFTVLGVDPARVEVTDTMKWDAVDVASDEPAPPGAGARRLAEALGLPLPGTGGPSLVVAGSTAPEETALLRDALPEGARLLVAPRRPEWFDGAAAGLPGCVRRSRGERATAATCHVVLDTIGELRDAYELADLVVTGRSFGDPATRHGSDMMEPAALGRAVVTGPAIEDFRSTVEALHPAGGLVVAHADELPGVLARLLDDADERRRIGTTARRVIRTRQGATRRTAAVLLELAGAVDDGA